MGDRRDSRRIGRWAITAGLLVLTAGLTVLWVQAPALYGESDAAKTAAATTRAGILTLGAALIAASAAGAAVWINHRTLAETQRANREEDQRERYSTAIEQLGSGQPSVQLGAIYTLERLAIDTERDHSTVVEVLSAFVREECPRTVAKTAPPDGRHSHQSTGDKLGEAESVPQLPTVVQATLTVLGRLPPRLGLPRADLSGAKLSGANLFRANLSGASLAGADLCSAHLSRVNLSGANLFRANLSCAFHFDSADLSGASLARADLSGVRLSGVNLSGANLFRANLSAASLIRAKLSGADLDGADLSGANLDGADLRTTRNLRQAQLDPAKGDARTELPEGLQRPSSWARLTHGN